MSEQAKPTMTDEPLREWLEMRRILKMDKGAVLFGRNTVIGNLSAESRALLMKNPEEWAGLLAKQIWTECLADLVDGGSRSARWKDSDPEPVEEKGREAALKMVLLDRVDSEVKS